MGVVNRHTFGFLHLLPLDFDQPGLVQAFELLHHVGMLGRQVGHLARVGGEVVMLVGIEEVDDEFLAVLDEAALREHLAERLVHYKLPATFEVVNTLLRDDAGKMRRSALRDERLR